MERDSHVVYVFLSRGHKTNSLPILGCRTLLEIFTAAERERTQKRLDFAGRLCTPPGQVAKLYPNLGLKDNAARSETDVK